MDQLCVGNGQKFLFIGDSITDTGRRTENAPYGNGYVSLFMELQRAMFPDLKIDYVNKGIGGNTARDLRGRWDEDVIQEQPDWLSVKIGINDVHRFLAGETIHAPDAFREDYEAILAMTKEQTDAALLLVDPFYIITAQDADEQQAKVLELLPEYIAIVHEMAEKYDTRLVRTHDMFTNQLKFVSADIFCPEPVHPFRSGHVCIAIEVMKALTT